MSKKRYTFKTEGEAIAFRQGVELVNHPDVYADDVDIDEHNEQEPWFVEVNGV